MLFHSGVFDLVFNQPLNRDRKLQSFCRFLRWQIGSRLLQTDIVFDWVNGAKFRVRQGETGLTGNIYAGLHEFPDMAFLLHFLRKEDVFADVGSNSGSYTILAGSSIGAKVYAFEPVPRTYARLVENVRINHAEDWVTCINKGVGAKKGMLRFTGGNDTTNHALAEGETAVDTVNVELVPLDDEFAIVAPNLMKIDVEGFETLVIKGAQRILRDSALRCVIMELNGSGARYGFDETDILRSMENFGFKTYTYDPFQRTLIPINGKNTFSGNTLFIREETFVVERVKMAPKISLFGKQF